MVYIWSNILITVPKENSISSAALFESIPQQDYFGLFNAKGTPNVKRVTEFLNYQKADIASVSGLSKASIRYDNKIPKELIERAREWAVAINLVGSFFQDEQKTILWFNTSNPLLGDVAPRDMIRMGRFKKLLSFIQTALAENKR